MGRAGRNDETASAATRTFGPAYGGGTEMGPTQRRSDFWILCEQHGEGSDPLTVPLPGFGEALAVFSFGEEALLYALLSGGGDYRRATPVDAAELSALLSEPGSRFGRVVLDPLPGSVAARANRSAGMHQEDFLDFLASRARKRLGGAVFPGARR